MRTMSAPTLAIARAGALLLAAAAACALPAGNRAAAAEKKSDRVSAGTWGGVGIGLEVTDSGGRLDFDCAHGTMEQAPTLDENGRFEVRGRFVREHGGPVREGEVENAEPVRYVGKVSGDSMTLSIQPLAGDKAIGDYTLARGKRPRIRKCL